MFRDLGRGLSIYKGDLEIFPYELLKFKEDHIKSFRITAIVPLFDAEFGITGYLINIER